MNNLYNLCESTGVKLGELMNEEKNNFELISNIATLQLIEIKTICVSLYVEKGFA